MVGVTAQTWLGEDEQRTWRLFLAMQAQLSAAMNRELQRGHDLSLADYAVLVDLDDAAGQRLRPGELGRLMQWEQSRLSHHLGRMERRGLVTRESCPDDRRGSFVVLTERGRASLVAAAPAHVDTVRRLVFDHLDADDLRALERISTDILTATNRLGTGEPA